MKARLLRKLLNNTGYMIHFCDDKICIGSLYVSKLITVDAKTMEIKFALAPSYVRNHRDSVCDGNSELVFIWDKLCELISTGELKDIIIFNDPTENMFPVYSVKDGMLIEQFTDKIEYGNTTHDGELIYENSHYANKVEAVERGIMHLRGMHDMYSARIDALVRELDDVKKTKFKCMNDISYYETLRDMLTGTL